MRRTLACLLFIGPLAACALGCSKFRRPERYDPFATTRRTPGDNERANNDAPRLVPPGRNNEVTQATREFQPRPIGRGQSSATGSGVPAGQSDEAESESIGSRLPVRTANRPDAGSTFGHAPDYSWIQGRLEYSALGGGVWKVRYAPLSVDDEYGGSVILESPPNTQRFQGGDIVYVEGRITARTARGPLPNPIFRAEQMNKANE